MDIFIYDYLIRRVEKEQLQKWGLTSTQFQQLLMSHQNSPNLQQAFIAMQMESGQVLAKHGIRPAM